MYVQIVTSEHESVMKNCQIYSKDNSFVGGKLEYFPDRKMIRYHAHFPKQLMDDLIANQVFDPTECDYEIVY